jgi:hypothetical protein
VSARNKKIKINTNYYWVESLEFFEEKDSGFEKIGEHIIKKNLENPEDYILRLAKNIIIKKYVINDIANFMGLSSEQLNNIEKIDHF